MDFMRFIYCHISIGLHQGLVLVFQTRPRSQFWYQDCRGGPIGDRGHAEPRWTVLLYWSVSLSTTMLNLTWYREVWSPAKGDQYRCSIFPNRLDSLIYCTVVSPVLLEIFGIKCILSFAYLLKCLWRSFPAVERSDRRFADTFSFF